MDFSNFWWQTTGGPAPYQITDSLRFRGAQKLERTFGANGDRTAFTVSCWYKHTEALRTQNILAADNGSNWEAVAVEYPTNPQGSQLRFYTLSSGGYLTTNAKLRDVSAWYHLVAIYDSNNATADDRTRLYINGVRQSVEQNSQPSQGAVAQRLNNALRHDIGALGTSSASSNSGEFYIAEYHFIDGQVLGPEAFGEFNDDGVWIPIEVNLTQQEYGANGFYLDFSDPNDIGADRSGNGNNWTPTGFELTDTTSASYDAMVDSPTGNFATLNPLSKRIAFTAESANLKLSRIGSGWDNAQIWSTFELTDGKWYWEVNHNNTVEAQYGVATKDVPASEQYSAPTQSWTYYSSNGNKFGDGFGGAGLAYGASYAGGDIIGIAFDADNGTLEFYKNGVSQGTAFSTLQGKQVSPYASNASPGTADFNFGQRPFAHTPPTGFQPLSTAQLPDVAITNPSEHFQTLLSNSYPHPPDTLTPGQDYGGGIYVGKYIDSGKVYNLIVAPRVSGGLNGQYGGATPSSIAWGYMNTTTGQQNWIYGGDASVALAGGVFGFLRDANGPNAGTFDITGSSHGTGIGGFNDWYIPSPAELQMAYRVMKPGTQASASQSIDAAVPAVTAAEYGQTTQATDVRFRIGGSEAWADGYYKSAFEENSQNSYVLTFSNGQAQGGHWGRKDNASIYGYARAVRREFAYDAGILDYAQQTFSQGLWWIKDRAISNTQHQLVDSVRGGNLAFQCPNTGAQAAYAAPAGNSVAWCWNAPDTWTDNSGAFAASGRRNQGAGFSIISTTPTGTGTIAHGLTQAPELIIACSTVVNNWETYHVSTGKDQRLNLYSNAAAVASGAWNNTAPTDSLISYNPGGQASNAHIIYAWHSVPGYSAFGQYRGNDQASDNTFVYLGFRPRFLIIKNRSAGADWILHDVERDTYNPMIHPLLANSANTERNNATEFSLDIVSNGFKIRSNTASLGNGSDFIYCAWAEHPFGGGNVAPSPAR